MKRKENFWPENEDFHFLYLEIFCIQVFYSVILRSYKCKILSMSSPFNTSESTGSEDLIDSIQEAVSLVDEKMAI